MKEIYRFGEDVSRRAVDIFHRNVVYSYLTGGEAEKDRKKAHERAARWMIKIQNDGRLLRAYERLFAYRDEILRTEFVGLNTPNPLGIGAGFDKKALVHRFLGEAAGFGTVKVGSITLLKYEGNPGNTIFPLSRNGGAINRMGFPGDGAEEAVNVLQKTNREGSECKKPQREYILIINFSASKPSFDRGTAIEDIVEVYKLMLPFGDADEENVSTPNTEGVRGLQEPAVYKELALELVKVRRESSRPTKPLISKLSPDLPREQREQLLKIMMDTGINATTLANTTTDKQVRRFLLPEAHIDEPGGISGRPLKMMMLEINHEASVYTGGALPICRSGGIENARDLWDALTYGGAVIAEVLTSYILRESSTPNYTYYILSEFAEAMRVEGMTNMEDFKVLRGKKVPYPLDKKK